MAPKKRPAAVKVEEPKTPPKKQKPAKAASPVKPTLEGEPAKAESTQPAKATAAKAKARGGEPEKAESQYPAPSREAWKDMRYQLQSLNKAGKGTHLNAKWAQQKSQSEKRTFYYEVFLLDPSVSKKEVHKESLQKQSSLERQVEGWMTEWEVGKLEGADPKLGNFESLCKAAVEGLPSRDHEVEAWARQGIKQYWYSKSLHKETTKKHSSETRTKETVGELEEEPFRKVEDALKVSEVPKTMMLGSKSLNKAVTDGQPGGSKDGQQEQQPEEGENYKKAVQGLKKAVNAYSSASNKVTTMLASLDKASEAVQADPQHAVSKIALQDLERSSSKERAHWNTALAAYPSSLDKAVSEVEKVEELQLEKSRCEKALKDLNKALAPTKVWAKDNGLGS